MRGPLSLLLTVVLGVAMAPGNAQRLTFGTVDVDPVLDLPFTMPPAAGPGWKLVQFWRSPTQAERDALELRGLRVVQYYPEHAWLVWGNGAALQRSAELPTVRWYGDFRPQWKRSANLVRRWGVINNVAVLAHNDGHVDDLVAAIESFGARVISRASAQPDGTLWQLIIHVDARKLDAIAALAPVLWLEYAHPRPTPDDEASSQIVAGNYTPTGELDGPGYPDFLGSLGLTGSGVTFAVTDSGVDYAHPELTRRIVGGYDYPGCESAPDQPGDDRFNGGHGTHVAGILAGAGLVPGATDEDGFHHGIGVAPEVDLVALNPICGSISEWPPPGGWQDLSQRALTLGAIGSNNSWYINETFGQGYQASERSFDFMVRDGDFGAPGNQPFVMLFSAGNFGPAQYTITAPKEAKNLIVVGAARSARPLPQIDHVVPSSSRGPAFDGRILPTVVAPGENVASTRRVGGGVFCAQPIAESGANADFAYCSGTSMAAPHASGIAVLLTQAWRQEHAGATPSPALLKALLVNGAVDMSGPPPVPNQAEGWGRVHLTRSLGSGLSRVVIDQTAILDDPDEEHAAFIRAVDPSQPVRITLAWTDAPGAPGANPALVNDLDLEVEAGGQTFRGNVFEQGVSATGGNADDRNNLENVFLPPSAGMEFDVRVRARALPGDGVPGSGDDTDQDYALVCSNCSDQPDYALSLSTTALSVCAGRNPLELDVSVQPLLGYADPVTFTIGGWPAPATANFDPVSLPVLPGASTLSLDSSGLPAGGYLLNIGATSLALQQQAQLRVHVAVQPPTPPIPVEPPTGATAVALIPTLRWVDLPGVSDYRVEVATDADFSQIVAATDTTLNQWTPTTPLAAATDHHWRVFARNDCSVPELLTDGFERPISQVGTVSETATFRTRN